MTDHALLTIGAELGVLDDDTRARLRAGVVELVATAAPGTAPGTAPLAAGTLARVGEPIVLDRADDAAVIDLTDHQERRDRRDPRRQGHAGRRLVAAAAAIVVLLGVGISVARRTDTGPDVQATQAVPRTAEELVAALRQAPDTPLPAGRYDYQRFETVDQSAGQLSQHEKRRWLGTDGRGRVTQTAQQVLSSNAPGAPRSAGLADAYDTPVTPNRPEGAGTMLPSEVRSLPTDATSLRANLVARYGIAADNLDGLHHNVIELLSFHGTPPAVRAALVQLLLQDGATVLPDAVQDRAGRSGVGLAVPRSDGQRTIVVLDPATLFRLGDFTLPANGSTSADAATAWRTVLENTVRDSTAG